MDTLIQRHIDDFMAKDFFGGLWSRSNEQLYPGLINEKGSEGSTVDMDVS